MVASVFKIKIIEEDEKTYYAHKVVKVHGKKFETPIKAIHLRNIRPEIKLAHSEFVAEIYKIFSKDSLQRAIMGDMTYQMELNKDIKKQIMKLPSKNLPILLIPALRVEALKNLELTSMELEFILNTQSIFDFYVVPTIERIHAKIETIDELERYLKLIGTYLELTEELKAKKPVVGIIPVTIPPIKLPELIDIYIEWGITAFALDFAGKVPFTHYQQVAQIQNILHRKDIDAFLYAINVNPGKPSKRGPAILAKDVLSIGFGLDAIGDNHIALGRTPQQDINLRLFNKDEYAYHKILPENIEEIYPEDTMISMEELISGPKSKRMDVQKMFNYEQIGIETIRVREKIDDREITKYVAHKPYVAKHEETLKILMKIKERKTISLESFLRKL